MTKLSRFKRYFFTVVGGFLVGLAAVLFLRPANLAPGGVSGLSVILNYLYSFPIWLSIILINIPVFIIGYISYGGEYIVVSAFGMLASSLSSYLFADFPLKLGANDLMLFSIFGGAVMGLGTGLAMSQDGGTGGTDILAKVMHVKMPAISLGKSSLVLNTVIIVLNGLAVGRIDVVLYSAITLFVSSKMIDMQTEGINYAKIAFIISEKDAEISEFILTKLKRGVTGLFGRSMYTRGEKNVLMSVIKREQINELKGYITETDPGAFVIVCDSREVLGLGFQQHAGKKAISKQQ